MVQIKNLERTISKVATLSHIVDLETRVHIESLLVAEKFLDFLASELSSNSCDASVFNIIDRIQKNGSKDKRLAASSHTHFASKMASANNARRSRLLK